MLQFFKRTAASVTAAAAGKVRLFVDSTDGLFKTRDENGVLTTVGGVAAVNGQSGNVTINHITSVTGNTGTATADQSDSIAITGQNGISTTASDNPEALVISPTYGSPSGLAPDGANAAGTANTFARSDHVHATPADVAVGLNGGTANGEGASASFARADHTHAISNGGTPTTIQPDATADQGTSTSLARSDHRHAIDAAAAVTLTPNAANAEGTSTSFARADHVHTVAAAAAVAIHFGSTNTEGTSSAFARADHTHAITNIRANRATEFLSAANNATAQTAHSVVVPAAKIAAGYTLQIEVAGTQTNAATSGGNNNIILTVNGTAIATATVAVGATAQTNRAYVASGTITFRSTTQVVGAVTQTISGVLPVSATNAAAPTTITAGDATIAIQVQTATANAGNTIRVAIASIVEV